MLTLAKKEKKEAVRISFLRDSSELTTKSPAQLSKIMSFPLSSPKVLSCPPVLLEVRRL